MAAPEAYTEAELLTIIRALETGLAGFVSGTSFQFRSVTYTSTKDILDRIAYFKGLLALVGGRPRQMLMVGRKGFSVGRFW